MEIRILYELWAGERLELEKAVHRVQALIFGVSW